MSVGGEHLLKHVYKGSLGYLLEDIYPEYKWLQWKFNKVPKLFWEKLENQKSFIKCASQQLNIKDMSDWYKITWKVLSIYYMYFNTNVE